MAKILIVDDDNEIRQMLGILLANEGYETVQAQNGKVALEMFNAGISLVLLDVMMPIMDGITTCIKLREISSVPIIFLTAKESDMDEVLGLGAGGDDYINKPFSASVLSARIRSVLRRSGEGEAGEQIITLRGLEIVPHEHRASVDGQNIKLTPTEFEILYLLAKNKGRVFSIEKIYETVWSEPYIKSSSNTVMVHVRKLREKLERDSGNPEYLKTEWGVGYKVE